MAAPKDQTRVGYVLRKFPVLSETFILNEILGLESQGLPVHILSLAKPNDPRYHENLARLKAHISYFPGLRSWRTLLKIHRKAADRNGSRYWRTLLFALPRPKLWWRFVQSGWVAHHARRYGLTHLHAHFATRPTTAAHLASRMEGIPYSFTAHAMDIFKSHLSKDALRDKIDNADFVVTISDYNERFLRGVSERANGKIVRVDNGIDTHRFQPNGTPPDDPFTILCVARLVEKKGHKVLVEACKLLRDRGVRFQCLLVGKGGLRGEIQRQIKESGLKRQVKLLGPHTQDEVLSRYHDSHVYVLPCVVGSDGNMDGLPVSIVEALSCGLPVVSTAVTGIPEVVRHEENGLIVPVGDAVALADALEQLAKQPRLLKKLKAGARPSVVERFDDKRTAERLAQLFQGGGG